MKSAFLIVILFFPAFADTIAQTNTITTFILVRHAEKENDGTDDPGLKAEGQERAKRFAALFKNASIDAVYSTRYKRTKNTVIPLAQEKGLEVQLYQAVKDDLIDELMRKHPGGTIVVGGHSNTIPKFANLLTGKEEFQTFPEHEYGTILMVTVAEKGKVGKVVKLNY